MPTYSVTRLGDLFDIETAAQIAGWNDDAMGNFLKPLETIILRKSPTFLGNFCKGGKSIIFLVRSFWGNIYRHLAIFFWSRCPRITHNFDKVAISSTP